MGVKSISFLLGSGFSIPAGYPSTQSLTESILSCENVNAHSSETFFVGRRNNYLQKIENQKVKIIKEYIKKLKEECDKYYTFRETNYEDYFSLSKQIMDAANFEYDNPGFRLLIRKLENDHKFPIKDSTGLTIARDLSWLSRITCDLINNVISKKLSKRAYPIEYYNFIDDCLSNNETKNVNFITLNHDILLEDILERKGYSSYIDGFKQKTDNLSTWTPRLIKKGNSINILKVHGSINWYYHGRYNLHKFEPTRSNESPLTPPGGHNPIIAIGTASKLNDYTQADFSDLFCKFKEVLHYSNILIVIGYGFGDKGINNQLFRWLGSNKKNKITIVTPFFKTLVKNARRALHINLRSKKDQFFIICKGVQNLEWQDIEEII